MHRICYQVLPYSTGNFSTEPLLVESGLGKRGYWSIRVDGLRLNGEPTRTDPSSFDCDGANVCIFDSGTTAIQLPTDALADLKAAFLRLCPAPLVGICTDEAGKPLASSGTILDGQVFLLNASAVAAYPTVEIVLSASALAVPPQNYLERDAASGYYYALLTGTSSGGGETIIGEAALRGFTTVFDANAMRVQLAPVSGCPSPSALQS